MLRSRDQYARLAMVGQRYAKNGDIPALTGLRGVAAYAVLFAHAINFAFAA